MRGELRDLNDWTDLGALDLKKKSWEIAVPMIHMIEPIRITRNVSVVSWGSSVSGTA